MSENKTIIQGSELPEFWQGAYPDGMSLQDVCNELKDYEDIIHEVSKVYCEITNSRLSKPNTEAIHIISAVEEAFKEDLKMYFDDIRELMNACKYGGVEEDVIEAVDNYMLKS